ncbi:MAG: hypothetical protein ACPGTS_01110, partial [Minisyncoccia bacterium]
MIIKHGSTRTVFIFSRFVVKIPKLLEFRGVFKILFKKMPKDVVMLYTQIATRTFMEGLWGNR